MKSVKVNIHSMVDVITNSSTVIYTWASGGIDQVKELVNVILKASGSEKKVEDLFFIEERLTDKGMENILDEMDESGDYEERIADFQKTFPDNWNDLPYEECKVYYEKTKEFLKTLYNSLSEEEREPLGTDSYYDVPRETSIYIKPKNGTEEEINMLTVFKSIFEQWATRD